MTIQIVKLIMSSINPLACHLKIPEKYGADRRIGGEDYEKKITAVSYTHLDVYKRQKYDKTRTSDQQGRSRLYSGGA